MKVNSASPLTILLLFCCKSCFSSERFNGSSLDNTPTLSEDGRFNWIQLATKYGFPKVEKRNVTTEDGYILTLYHIPGDPQKPVLLSHGNTASAYCWIVRGNSSLAITLAARGYDVWAINYRGTVESRRHVSLDANVQKTEFYNYSFYEHAVYDLPATIDLILGETKQESLLAIGHSVGAMTFYVLGAERPEYNDKLRAFISLAPVMYMQNTRGSAAVRFFREAAAVLGGIIGLTNEWDRQLPIEGAIWNSTCLGPLSYEICVKGIIFPLYGPDPEGFEPEFVHTFFGHYPGGSSRKMSDHLFQIREYFRFGKYNYGSKRNLLVYGNVEPPEFDLKKVSMKVVVFLGKEDYLSTLPDGLLLRRSLPNVVHYQVMPYEGFNHFDFCWGRYMPTNLYPYLMPLIKKYI